MTCYVADHEKKRRALARNESQLLRILRRGGSEEEIIQAAEDVRASMVRVLYVTRARIKPSSQPTYAAAYETIDNEIARCLSLPLETIVSRYRGFGM